MAIMYGLLDIIEGITDEMTATAKVQEKQIEELKNSLKNDEGASVLSMIDKLQANNQLLISQMIQLKELFIKDGLGTRKQDFSQFE